MNSQIGLRLLRPFHCHRIKGLDTNSPLGEEIRNIQGRGISHIICVRLERQPQQADRAPLEQPQFLQQLLHDPSPLPIIDFTGSLHNRHIKTIFGGDTQEGRRILAETTTAPTDTCVQETRPYARVKSNPAGNLPDISTHAFGQLGDLIDVADLQRQEGVGSVLDQFRRRQIGRHEGDSHQTFRPGKEFRWCEVLIQNGAIKVGENVYCFRVLRTEHDPIGIEGIQER